jgi:putative membrane protein
MKTPSQLKLILILFSVALIWSAIKPHDYFTWFLEVLPALSALAILLFTYRRFQFTQLAYWLMFLHSIILIIGGHYTYERVPLFNWIRDTFSLQRNSYDGVGHFAQGFFPAIVAREILMRTSPLVRSRWLPFMVICVLLALSAFYELIEWWVSLASGSAGDAFLGSQGDIWDTQKDMALCLIGSILSLLLLTKPHDRALQSLVSVK